ncbi:MAG: hypothetical protein KME13_18410 [Myxacorys californica WJT36-NPBG1]|jgi:hypothetical protein|nr:hypothetical protein [Myxacorys californica WJT36-NPBG1]
MESKPSTDNTTLVTEKSSGPTEINLDRRASSGTTYIAVQADTQAKVIDAVLQNTAGVGLGVILCTLGLVVVANWLGIKDVFKSFIKSQSENADSMKKLASGVEDLVRTSNHNREDIDRLTKKVDGINDTVQEIKHK